MVEVSLYFFEDNVIISRFDTTWNEVCQFLLKYLYEQSLKSEFECDFITKFDLFCDEKSLAIIENGILNFRECLDPSVVCDKIIFALESLGVCAFKRKILVGENYFLRGSLSDGKNFLIEVSNN